MPRHANNNYSADDTPRWPVWFRIGLPLLIAFALLGHTLSLPWSLIDDGLFFERARAMSRGSVADWWNLLWTPEDNRFGPGLILQIWIMYLFGGSTPWVWHLLKILQFAALVGGMLEAVRLGGFRRLHGVAAVVAFCIIGRPLIFSDIQTHIANWQRLHTTDSHYIWLIVWVLVFLTRALAAEGPRAWLWIAAAGIAHAIAALTKINVVGYSAGAIIALLVLAWWRRGAGARTALVAAGVILLASLPGVLFFKPWNTSEILDYNASFSLSPSVYAHSFALAFWIFLECWAHFLFAAVIWSVWRFAHVAMSERHTRQAAFWMLVPGLGLAAFVLQSGWPIWLQRYAVTYTPFFSLVTGVFVGEAILYAYSAFSTVTRRATAWLVGSVFAGALLIFLAMLPVYFCPTLLRLVPLMLTTGAFAVSFLIWILRVRRGKPFGLMLTATVAGLFLGPGALQVVLMTIYLHDAAVSYSVAEDSYSAILDVLETAAESHEPGTPPVDVHWNVQGEPTIQAQAFIRAFGWSDKVRLHEIWMHPEIEGHDRIVTVRREDHFEFRLVPPFFKGWAQAPLIINDDSSGAVPLLVDHPVMRRMDLQPGTRVTGYELWADTVTWPPQVDVEVVLRDASGERAMVRFPGRMNPRMRSSRLFAPLEEPFQVEGDWLEAEARLVAGEPGWLDGYLLSRAKVTIFGASGQDGQLVVPGTPYVAEGPQLYEFEKEWEISGNSVICLPPGSLAGYYYYGGWLRGPASLGGREVGYLHEVEVLRPRMEP